MEERVLKVRTVSFYKRTQLNELITHVAGLWERPHGKQGYGTTGVTSPYTLSCQLAHSLEPSRWSLQTALVWPSVRPYKLSLTKGTCPFRSVLLSAIVSEASATENTENA